MTGQKTRNKYKIGYRKTTPAMGGSNSGGQLALKSSLVDPQGRLEVAEKFKKDYNLQLIPIDLMESSSLLLPTSHADTDEINNHRSKSQLIDVDEELKND